jgi:signal transduction histidine kinase/CheY-like chemotaxis protein
MNCRRGLISFFDRRNCYILAEATPTLSLQSGMAATANDQLQWGRCIFPKQESICYYTVSLPADDFPLNPADPYSKIPSLVVNDLARDERFKNYASVTGPARSRFYAGVPIKSPSGHNIGTYCVLDDKPRDGISDDDMLFLKDMAVTVMRHLEMTRAVDEHRRGGVMVRSLGSFAEGKNNLEEWWPESWGSETAPPDAQLDGIPVQRQRRRTTASSAGGAGLDIRDPLEISSTDGYFQSTSPSLKSPGPSLKSPNLTTPESNPPGSEVITPASDVFSDARRTSTVPTKSSSSTKDDPDKYKLSPEVKALFSRAANMIREATEADGAVFFDAKVSTFGGLVEDEFLQDQQAEITDQDKPCAVLGASITEAGGQNSLSEALLRHLLRTYPHGQIFNFDDENAWALPHAENIANLNLTVSETLQKVSTAVRPERPDSSKSQDDENLLKEAFPTARSLVLYPLWDSHRDRWFAGAIVWSPDPMRVFSNEQELSYLAAFSNSIMAEVARLDIKLADAAKGDFISSVSHELRSPLHGILGCCELLKDSPLSSFQSNMAQTIETCGKTLLDTINHVLDFAKINSLTTGTAKRNNRRSQSTKQMISPAQSHTNDIMTLITDVDLCVLTEEVLETVFAGYNFQKSATSQVYGAPTVRADVPHLTVIVDINKSDNYVFRTQPGAWRRVLMNLFGNALKYTPSGYTKVRLQVTPSNNPFDGLAEFKLIVTDSGIGMSEDYVHNRLFHSFAQENPLSQGTGLGLSIVKQIVESLGGDIEVRSQKHHGTKFTITCPLKKSMFPPADPCTHPDREVVATRKRTEGLKVAFVGFETENDYFPAKSYKNRNATLLSLNALETLCKDWFGMHVVSHAITEGAVTPDLFIASESGARALRAEYSTKPGFVPSGPVIVVCKGAASAHTTTAITDSGQTFECISQPCGPHKLGKALESSLDRHANRLMALSQVTDSVLPALQHLTLKDNSPPTNPSEVSPILKPLNNPNVEAVRPSLTPVLSAPQILSTSKAHGAGSQMRPNTPRPLNCLAADDNPINLRLLRCFIEKLHHKHSLAINGVEAVTLYKAARPEERFDVVLMDINMPEMNGLEATRQIRAYERDAGLKPVTIIALTGVASSEAQQEAHVSGVNLFLIKPVRLHELETVLNGVVIGDDHGNTTIGSNGNGDGNTTCGAQ